MLCQPSPIGNVVGRRSLRHTGFDFGLLRNKLILLGVVTEIVFSLAILYFPSLQMFLGTGPVDWHIYALAWLGVPLMFGFDLLRKYFLQRFPTVSRFRKSL